MDIFEFYLMGFEKSIRLLIDCLNVIENTSANSNLEK